MNKENLNFKNSSKVFSIIIIFILLLNSFSTLCLALSTGDTVTVECIMTAAEAIDNWGYAFLADWDGDGSYSYMQSTCFYGWYDDDGNLYPAYCLDYGDAGAEEYSSGYDTIAKAYDNDKIYSVLYYGYGYNTATSLGLDNKYDAAIATQYAVWAITEGWDLDDMIKSTGTTRSDNIVSVMKSIYKKAINNTVSYSDPDVTISKSGSLTEKTIDGTDYYIQKYTVSSGNTIDSYRITLSNATSNTVIYDSSLSSKITGKTTASSFYVCIPADEIDEEMKIRVNVDAYVNSYPVFYLSTTVSGTQNYATIADPAESSSDSVTISITLPDVTIQKKDRDTGELLEGAEFDIIDLSTGEVVEHVTTGSDGTVTIEDMPVGEYQVVETVAPDGYDLDCDTITFEIEANGEDVTVTATDTVAPVIYKQARDGSNEGAYLAGAVYEVWLDTDEDGAITEGTDTLVYTTEATNEEGYTNVTGLEIGQYIVREIEAPEGYNLDSEEFVFTISTTGSAVTIYTDDTVITSTLIVSKEAETDSEITGLTAGTLLANATFEIYDTDGNYITSITTDETGQANVELEYGTYVIKEVEEPEYYLLDEDNTAEFTVSEDGAEIELTFADEAVSLGLEITKSGIVQTQANDEIRYNFTITNNSNVDVDNFTWTDNLPYEYVSITKLFTGVYNYDHDYTIWYKIEGSDEWIQYVNEDTEDGTYNTLENHYIDFTAVDGTVTDFKIEYGTVEGDFAANEDEEPFIFCKVSSEVGADDEWTNYTSLTGDYTSNQGSIVKLEDTDEWTTISYAYSLSVTKLPKTGK